MHAAELTTRSGSQYSCRKTRRRVKLLYSSKKELQRSRTRRRIAAGTKSLPPRECCTLRVHEDISVDVKNEENTELELLDLCAQEETSNILVSTPAYISP